MSPDDSLGFLRGTDILHGMSPAAVSLIAGQMRPRRLAAGETLFDEGSAGDAAYLIVEGELSLTSRGVEVARWGPGALVGEFSLIDDQPRSASGIARTPLRVLAWERRAFLAAMAADPEIARGILRMLTRKLRSDSQRGVGLVLEQERWRHDLDRSREIQRGMLPPEVLRLDALEVAGHCAPAGAVGGDFYDVLSFGDGRVGVMATDVTGHGLHCGLFVAMAKSCLHTQARIGASPVRMMGAIRRALALSLDRRMLMTCAYFVLDSRSGRLAYANAGHPHPLLWRAESGRIAVLEVLDPILGAQEPGESRYRSRTLAWRPGDLLVLYSDGVTEVRDAAGREFGRERLEHALACAAHGDAVTVRDAILDAVRGHGAGTAPRDDLTLVVARAVPGPT